MVSRCQKVASAGITVMAWQWLPLPNFASALCFAQLSLSDAGPPVLRRRISLPQRDARIAQTSLEKKSNTIRRTSNIFKTEKKTNNTQTVLENQRLE